MKWENGRTTHLAHPTPAPTPPADDVGTWVPMDATVDEAAAEHTRGPFPCIDGVRAIAALAVIAFHSVVTSDPTLRTAGVRWLIHPNIGVWVFFVISGFLLHLPFARHHLSGRPRSSVQDYAIRRVARIYPAYWVALAFWLFVLPRTNIGGAGGPLAYVTLTRGYFTTDISRGIPVAWTLVTEVSFYAFLPVYTRWPPAGSPVVPDRRFRWSSQASACS